MKILKEKNSAHSGNDCWIESSVALLEFSETNYLVVSTKQFLGGWTDNAIATSTWEFKSREEAYTKYNQVAGGLT